jgi:hypothetical protein
MIHIRVLALLILLLDIFPNIRSMKRTNDSIEDPTGKRQKVEEPNSAANGFNAAGDVDNVNDLKRTKLSIPLLPKDTKTLLLDIEGK